MPTPGNRPGLPTRRRPPAPLLAVGGVLGLALVAAAVRPPWQLVPRSFGLDPKAAPNELPSGFAPPTASMSPPPPTDHQPFPPVPWLKWVVLGLLVAVLAFLLVRWLRRRLDTVAARVKPVDEFVQVVPELPVLQRGAEAAERHLIAGGHPTDAIVAAWMALEEAAESTGVVRRPAETPTEFTTDVLHRTGVDPGAVQTLLRLYLRARFSAAGADADDLETARRCVRTLATSWGSFASYELSDDGLSDDPAVDR